MQATEQRPVFRKPGVGRPGGPLRADQSSRKVAWLVEMWDQPAWGRREEARPGPGRGSWQCFGLFLFYCP